MCTYFCQVRNPGVVNFRMILVLLAVTFLRVGTVGMILLGISVNRIIVRFRGFKLFVSHITSSTSSIFDWVEFLIVKVTNWLL